MDLENQFATKAGAIAFLTLFIFSLVSLILDWQLDWQKLPYILLIISSAFFACIFSGIWYTKRENITNDYFTLSLGACLGPTLGWFILWMLLISNYLGDDLGIVLAFSVLIGFGLALAVKLVSIWALINQ